MGSSFPRARPFTREPRQQLIGDFGLAQWDGSGGAQSLPCCH
jgi:hypothetical protein